MSQVRLLRGVLLVTGCLGFSGCGSSLGDHNLDGGSDAGTTRTLVILHSNDEHSHLLGLSPEIDDHPAPTVAGTGVIKGGIARRATLLKSERMAAEAVGAGHITISGGDNTMGTLTQVVNAADSPDYTIMGQLQYTATTFGNHEFDFGPATLAKTIQVAMGKNSMPPVVATNIKFSDADSGDDSLAALFDETGSDMTKPIHRFMVINKGGIKIGLIGCMGADASHSAQGKSPITFSLPSGGDENDYASVHAQIFKDLQPFVDKLRDKSPNGLGVDVVVMLSHGGSNTISHVDDDIQIAQHVAGIDVIASGHTHTKFPAQVFTNLDRPDGATLNVGNSTIIQQALEFGEYLGKIVLTVDAAGKVTFDTTNSKLIPIDDTLVADSTITPEVDKAVSAVESDRTGSQPSFLEHALNEILSPTTFMDDPTVTGDLYFKGVGTTAFNLVSQNHVTKNPPDLAEQPGLVLSADAMLWAAEKYAGPTDVAVQVGGLMRGNLDKGKTGVVSAADVFRVLPLGAGGDGTLGSPLVRFAVLGAEIRAAFEVTASGAYTPGSGFSDFLLPSGMQYSFDLSRGTFDSSLALTPCSGRVTKIMIASDHTKLNTFDTTLLDATDCTNGNATYLKTNLFVVVTDLFTARFAAGAGIHLKTYDGSGLIAKPEDAIVHRSDGSEVKDWEALAEYIHSQLNSAIPARYDSSVPGNFPTRVLCSGVSSKGVPCEQP